MLVIRYMDGSRSIINRPSAGGDDEVELAGFVGASRCWNPETHIIFTANEYTSSPPHLMNITFNTPRNHVLINAALETKSKQNQIILLTRANF